VQLKIQFNRTLPKHKANVFNFLYCIKFMRIIINDKFSLLSFIWRNLFWASWPRWRPTCLSSLLIGHNASTFDTPLLLRSTPSTFSAKLKSLRIIFADSLVLIKQLQSCSINFALLSNLPNNNLDTLYGGLSKRNLMRTMHSKMLKRCPKYYFIARSLQVTVQQILEHSRSTTVDDFFLVLLFF
jgi:hypothetical protein